MIIKKTKSLFPASHTQPLSYLASTAPPSHTSSTSPCARPTCRHHTPPAPLRAAAIRLYASVSASASSPSSPPWPAPPTGHRHPTPYQIFSLQPSDRYTKARFYELVKIYHPDTSCNHDENCPHHLKLERYRLIVTAHAILSDPEKRRAYDRFGAGWAGAPEAATSSNNYGRPGPFNTRYGGNGYRDYSDPIWANATWEDWERFYARQAQGGGSSSTAPPPQAPVYFRNSFFLALVIMMAMIGSSANYKRGEVAGAHFLADRDAVHDRAAKELRRVRQEREHLKAKDERIEWFVRQREATMLGIGVDELMEERARAVLPDAERCGFEDEMGAENVNGDPGVLEGSREQA